MVLYLLALVIFVLLTAFSLRFRDFVMRTARYIASFLLFALKWLLPTLCLLWVIFKCSLSVIELTPKHLRSNEFLMAFIPAIFLLSIERLLSAYVGTLQKKGKHLKRLVLTLTELNRIYQILYRNQTMVEAKLLSYRKALTNLKKIRQGVQVNQAIAHLNSDPFENFINISEESKYEILNVDLINAIESFMLQIDSNNFNLKLIQECEQKRIKSFDQWLQRYNQDALTELDSNKMISEFSNLIDILNNLRKELNKTKYYSLFLFTQLGVHEREDRISFDIWVITTYLSTFNKRFKFNETKKQLENFTNKQFQLKRSEVKTGLKCFKKEIARLRG